MRPMASRLSRLTLGARRLYCMPGSQPLRRFSSADQAPNSTDTSTESSAVPSLGLTNTSDTKGHANPNIPLSKSSNHHDLASFLQYAKRTGLGQETTIFVGTHYEYTVSSLLAAYGFSLNRVGGQHDFGIDLLGTWSVPTAERPLRVIVQCKAIQVTRPHLIRELEGAFVGAPVGWRGSEVFGVLVASKIATKGTRDALVRSRWPLVFIGCSREGKVEQLLWNHRAEQEGLQGLVVAKRHSPDGGEQLVLTHKGKHLPLKKVEGLPAASSDAEQGEGSEIIDRKDDSA
ncbi:hypothetical protein SMACR_01728 [Sordaria macrospora]|uniref:Required for respiratory growth protein 7, mitochondrial n=1 Tax=Sordaria macrospora TaxID=5147 RepID=A0A8S8ZYE9_SORMA|nr:hypothetical protein SMACR_01728 [Sordaria macrospora]KAH7626255.1 hypothetical protein B0T09DRAFT_52797 [Sordaria sp. MPI-SDFR-AT-0083]WPJ61420.1 hypothetical protein SMAC4_01728 [Sordaria macrospora]